MKQRLLVLWLLLLSLFLFSCRSLSDELPTARNFQIPDQEDIIATGKLEVPAPEEPLPEAVRIPNLSVPLTNEDQTILRIYVSAIQDLWFDLDASQREVEGIYLVSNMPPRLVQSTREFFGEQLQNIFAKPLKEQAENAGDSPLMVHFLSSQEYETMKVGDKGAVFHTDWEKIDANNYHLLIQRERSGSSTVSRNYWISTSDQGASWSFRIY